jgi:hypothetical protein
MEPGNLGGHEQVVRERAQDNLVKLPLTQVLAALPAGPAAAARGGGRWNDRLAFARMGPAAHGDDVPRALMPEGTEWDFRMPAPIGF